MCGVFYDGMAVLGASAILVAMMLAAIVARVIDRNYLHAAVFALLAALMSFFGVIHSTGFGIGMATGPAIGYFVIAAGCFLFHVTRGSQPSARRTTRPPCLFWRASIPARLIRPG